MHHSSLLMNQSLLKSSLLNPSCRNKSLGNTSFAIKKLVVAIKQGIIFSTFALGAASYAHAEGQVTQNNSGKNQTKRLSTVKVSAAAEAAPYQSGNTDIARSIDDAQPYTVIDRDVIERSGATSVEELLQKQLTMSASTVSSSEAGADGFSGGASKINLRGLGASQTLVLIDQWSPHSRCR